MLSFYTVRSAANANILYLCATDISKAFDRIHVHDICCSEAAKL